jgi:hypothetical protein
MNTTCPECKNNIFFLETLEVAVRNLLRGVYFNEKKRFNVAMQGLKVLIPKDKVEKLPKEAKPLMQEAIKVLKTEEAYEHIRQQNARMKKFFQDRLSYLRQIAGKDAKNIENKKVEYNLRDEYKMIGEALIGSETNNPKKEE